MTKIILIGEIHCPHPQLSKMNIAGYNKILEIAKQENAILLIEDLNTTYESGMLAMIDPALYQLVTAAQKLNIKVSDLAPNFKKPYIVPNDKQQVIANRKEKNIASYQEISKKDVDGHTIIALSGLNHLPGTKELLEARGYTVESYIITPNTDNLRVLNTINHSKEFTFNDSLPSDILSYRTRSTSEIKGEPNTLKTGTSKLVATLIKYLSSGEIPEGMSREMKEQLLNAKQEIDARTSKLSSSKVEDKTEIPKTKTQPKKTESICKKVTDNCTIF